MAAEEAARRLREEEIEARMEAGETLSEASKCPSPPCSRHLSSIGVCVHVFGVCMVCVVCGVCVVCV